MNCYNCEEHLKSGDKFCQKCGTAIEEVNETSVQQSNECEVEKTDEQLPSENETNVPDKPDNEIEATAESDMPAIEPEPCTPVGEPESHASAIESEANGILEKEKLGKKKLTIIIASATIAVAVIAVAVVFLVMHLNRISAFEEATELMDSGNYAVALEMFEDLGDFRESEELALESRLRIDYYAAHQQMDRGNYQGAREAFQALGAFRTSAELAAECQRRLDYYVAIQLMDAEYFIDARAAFEALGDFRDSVEMIAEVQLEIDFIIALEYMDSGDYETARELFEILGSFRDSAELAEECYNRIVYGEAVALASAGNHADAILLLEPLAEIGFRDSGELLLASNNVITFGLAEEAYDAGLFYTAHNLFLSLGDYRNSAERAEQSIQEHPETGQLYRNDDFSGTAVQLRIRTPSEDPRPTVLKIYTADEVLVSTVFIRSGASHTVRLPPGTYMIRMGFGDNWFGPYEYFGDANAFYLTLLLDEGGGTTYELRRNFIYTLYLRQDHELFDIMSAILNEGRDRF